MNSLETVFLVIQLILAVFLIGVILFQRTAQDGGGLVGGGGGGTMGGLFTARGSANALTRITTVLATLFILNSLWLGYIASSQHQTRSIIDRMVPPAPAATGPVMPAAPDAAKAGLTPPGLPIPLLPSPGTPTGQPTPLVPAAPSATPAAPAPPADAEPKSSESPPPATAAPPSLPVPTGQ